MKTYLLLAALLASSLSGCAHVTAIERDVVGCVKVDEPQAVVDLEKAAPKLVEAILMCASEGGEVAPACPPETTCAPAETAILPMCVTTGLATVVLALGPDGQRFETCVLNAVENDPAAAPLAKARAKNVETMLLRERGGGR